MNFEVYEPSRAADGRGIPTVRVLSKGRIILNAPAQRMLGDVTFVQLLWDDTTKRFGIKPSDQMDPTAFRVTSAPSQSVITSIGFVTDHKLPTGVRMKLRWDGTMYVASTTDPANPIP